MKKLSFRGRCFVLALVIALRSVENASADTFGLESKSGISLQEIDGEVAFSGSYQLTNRSADAFYEVTPSVGIGGRIWVGEPRRLQAGATETWNVNWRVPASSLDCAGEAGCNGFRLEPRGFFPLVVNRTFKTREEFTRSMVDVVIVPVKSTKPLEKESAIEGGLTCSGGGQNFKCTLHLQNTTARELSVLTRITASTDLQPIPEVMSVNLSPHSERSVEYRVVARSANHGTGYTVYGIVEWRGLDSSQTNLYSTEISPTYLGRKRVKYALSLAAGLLTIVFAALRICRFSRD